MHSRSRTITTEPIHQHLTVTITAVLKSEGVDEDINGLTYTTVHYS